MTSVWIKGHAVALNKLWLWFEIITCSFEDFSLSIEISSKLFSIFNIPLIFSHIHCSPTEVRVSDITKTTSERETPQPAPSSSTSQTTSTRPKKTCSSRQGLDKVFHNAKNRALSAIFNKNASDHGENGGGTKTKVKIKEMKNSGADHKTSTIASPLVSSLVSPRTVLDYPEPPSTSIFHRTVFCFSKKNATIKNNSSHQLPNSAR